MTEHPSACSPRTAHADAPDALLLHLLDAPGPAWAGASQWRIVDTRSSQPINLLRAWHAWQQQAQRPALLHYLAALPAPELAGPWRARVREALAPSLQPLADELAGHWWGLTPGLHRIALQRGEVMLTLWVGEPGAMLRELAFPADAVLLDDATALTHLQAVARLCRRGTVVVVQERAPSAPGLGSAVRDALTRAGFRLDAQAATSAGSVDAPANALAGENNRSDPPPWSAIYDPHWTPRSQRARSGGSASLPAGQCIVIGAGLAGAAAAAALAQRGWQVQVLDAAAAPASGASALPAGLMAPHLSPDDNLLSRLSRHGIRATWQQARSLLREGIDWQGHGALEHRLRTHAPPLGAQGFAADWSRDASEQEHALAQLPQGARAVWHTRAAWIRPAALVRAWLEQPGIRWQGGVHIARLDRPDAEGGPWQLFNERDEHVAHAPLVVIAAALGSSALGASRLVLHPVRGQVSWGLQPQGALLPAFPLNGNGHLLPCIPTEAGPSWVSGSSYGRGETATDERDADHAANLARLQALVPPIAMQLAPAFEPGQVRGWAGVRCASTDRRPLVGELEPGLWVSTAMGSRGLTFAALCAQLLAARLHDEPLPLPLSLATALDLGRQRVA